MTALTAWVLPIPGSPQTPKQAPVCCLNARRACCNKSSEALGLENIHSSLSKFDVEISKMVIAKTQALRITFKHKKPPLAQEQLKISSN
jgi:hypothetical protein